MAYHVQGGLLPSLNEAINDDTRNIIRKAASRHSLTLFITDIHRGAIKIDGTFGYFGNQGIDPFLRALNNFLQDETIVRLGLEGLLLIAEDGAFIKRVLVQEGRIAEQ